MAMSLSRAADLQPRSLSPTSVSNASADISSRPAITCLFSSIIIDIDSCLRFLVNETPCVLYCQKVVRIEMQGFGISGKEKASRRQRMIQEVYQQLLGVKRKVNQDIPAKNHVKAGVSRGIAGKLPTVYN